MRKRHNVAHAVGQAARMRTARAAGVWLALLVAFGVMGGCARDGGPHPEPPAPIDDGSGTGGVGSGGMASNPDSNAGAGGAGGAGGAAGSAGAGGLSGGMGGAGGFMGQAGEPECGDMDAGVDAEIEDEDAGPLR